MSRRFTTAAISAATALTVTFAGISPAVAQPAPAGAVDVAAENAPTGSSSKPKETPDLGTDEHGNPIRDYGSSIKPLIESTSEGSAYRTRRIDDAELKEKWDDALSWGHFSDLVSKIFKLEFNDPDYTDPSINDEYDAGSKWKTDNLGKRESEENATANKVLASSLKTDAARGQQFGVTLNFLIGGAAIALIVGIVAGLQHFGVVKLPKF